MFETKQGLHRCALALAVTMALGLSGCGGGGSNVRPSGTGPHNYNISFDDSTRYLAAPIAGSDSLTKGGTGTLVVDDNYSYTGGTTINGGTLQIGDGGTTGAIAGNVIDNATLAFNRADQIVFTGSISGSGKVIQEGKRKPTFNNPIVTLMGNNTYTGGTFVESGILIISGTIVGDVENHGILVFSPIKDWTYNGIISGDGSVEITNANTIKITGHSTYTGGTTVSGGTLEVAPGGVPGAGPVTVEVGGVGEAFKIDSGVVLTNHVVMDSGVMINAGAIKAADGTTLVTSSPSGFGFGKVVNQGGGTIEGRDFAINMGTPQDIVNTGYGSTISSPSGIAIRLAKGGSVANQDGAVISGAHAAIELGMTGTVTNGVGSLIEVTGAGGFAIDGPVNLTNQGAIIGSVGSVDGASSATLWYGSTIKGDLDLGASHGADIASLTLTGPSGSTGRYSGVVSGHTVLTGALKKAGGGTWIIDNNELSNVTSVLVHSGTLQVGDGGTVGSVGNGSVMLHNATLAFDRSDDVTFGGNFAYSVSSIVGQPAEAAVLVQEGTGTLTLTGSSIAMTDMKIEQGAIRIGSGALGPTYLSTNIIDDGKLIFGGDADVSVGSTISGSGSLTQAGSGVLTLEDTPGGAPLFTYTGGTYVQAGTLQASGVLPGDVFVSSGAVLRGYTGPGAVRHFPGAKGSLTNAGVVVVRNGVPMIGGNYVQSASGTLAVSLGSVLQISGSATLNGGTLEVTGANDGYTANDHTDVLTAAGGVSGMFDKLVKDQGVVFTSTTIGYGTNDVWLDTTGLDITIAAAGDGVSYTPASMGSAVRVQGAFEKLDTKIATGSVATVSGAFVQNAGAFQQSPNYRTAQASLESLSGQLHAASAGMTLQAVGATGRALSDRLERLATADGTEHMWMRALRLGGTMARSGYANVDYRLNGWLMGSDMRLGPHVVAGVALGRGNGREQLTGRLDRNYGRHTAGMAYVGWVGNRWYAHGRVGVGHFDQRMTRRLLLGTHYQGVWTDYDGSYHVAYGETGLDFDVRSMQLTPFVNLEYDRVNRSGFAEHGAGGFGLKADAQTISRWQSGIGVKLQRQWYFGNGQSVSVDARVQWRQTLAASGTVFDASFVGVDEWRPLTGVGLSRHSAVFGVDLSARLSAYTHFTLGYDYLAGDRGRAGMASANVTLRF